MINEIISRDASGEAYSQRDIPSTSVVQRNGSQSSVSNVNQKLGKTTQATEFQDLAKGLEQAFTTYANASIKASSAKIVRASGGYLSATYLLSAERNITNVYQQVSQQLTTAKQAGMLFDVARYKERDIQSDGNRDSAEALSVAEYKAKSMEIEADFAKRGAYIKALSSIAGYYKG